MPAHILFRKLAVDLFPKIKEKSRLIMLQHQTSGLLDDRLTQKHPMVTTNQRLAPPPHLLAFDLLHGEVVTLHGVTPALAVPPAGKRRGLGALAQVRRGQRSGLGAKADGAL